MPRRTIADLLAQARPPFEKVVARERSGLRHRRCRPRLLRQILNTLPDKYRALGRLGLYGDFFSFYLCDAVLKFNGKGGQPVFVKVAGQVTGRCAPK